MGMMQQPATNGAQKRKAIPINSLLEAKRSCSTSTYRKELAGLVERKQEFLRAQRRASLLVDHREMGCPSVMNEFEAFYRKLASASVCSDDHKEYQHLIKQTIKESIVIEWPRQMTGLSTESDESVEIDFAPLIHRARNVVKCRTSHPTMRIMVYSISKESDGAQQRPMEAFFRASLVKLANDGGDSRCCQVAGRMILTQREGTAATRMQDQCGATVNADGKLVASQSSTDMPSSVLLTQMGECSAKTTSLKFEGGTLCATFPEMGVTLNSMVDRRQLATRYAIQVEVGLNIDNKLIVNHVVVSHPFLIAITNDQTEPLMQSIFWQRLLNTDHNEPTDLSTDHSTVTWQVLRQSIRGFVKAQVAQARFLTTPEIRHVQCMILLPRIFFCQSSEQVRTLEMLLFGSIRLENDDVDPHRHLRNRLLNEDVLPSTMVERKEFLADKRFSILDMRTELGHSVWFWLFRATEMIQDVGHRLCPSPSIGDKKSTKTKKQMAASEDYQTMLSLFNKQIITFYSVHDVAEAFLGDDDGLDAMAIRFCDENSGYFSFICGVEKGKPVMGSISSEHVKDFKQGLPELLFDEHFPSKFPNLIRFEFSQFEDVSERPEISVVSKRTVFNSYTSQRLTTSSVRVTDKESVRVDVLSGTHLPRVSPAPQPSHASSTTSLGIDWPAFGESISNLALLQTIAPLLSAGASLSVILKSLAGPGLEENDKEEDVATTSEDTKSTLDTIINETFKCSTPEQTPSNDMETSITELLCQYAGQK